MRLFFPFRIWEYYFFFLCREHHNTANREDRQDSEQSFSFWEKKKKKTFSLAEIAYKKEAVRNEGESVKIVEREREREVQQPDSHDAILGVYACGYGEDTRETRRL